MERFSSLVLALAGLGFLGFGLAILVAPAAVLAPVGISGSAAGLVELQAFYGGLEIGLGAFLLGAAWHAPWRRPGLWVVLSAFRPNREILAKPPIWVPEDISLVNFGKIFGFGAEQVGIPVGSYFTNSLIIALTSTVIALMIGVGGGYAFARYRFRFKGGIFLGLNGTVVKSHGSADATGVSAAIKLAFTLAKSGFQDRLAARVAQGAAATAGAAETGASS